MSTCPVENLHSSQQNPKKHLAVKECSGKRLAPEAALSSRSSAEEGREVSLWLAGIHRGSIAKLLDDPNCNCNGKPKSNHK
mmetsp:Transcript_154118/g.273368  ORF Transcript_154118/g.273368 Transcript_154118/m.273368 type:complete len:81 (-) Transcript_154118:43-285(-)